MLVLNIVKKLDKEIVISHEFGIVLCNLSDNLKEDFINQYIEDAKDSKEMLDLLKQVAESIVIMKFEDLEKSRMYL